MGGQERELDSLLAGDLARALFLEAGDGLLIVEPLNERLLDVNPMAEKLTRLARDALLRLSLRDVLRHEAGSDEWLGTVRHTTTFHGQDGYLLRTDRPPGWLPVSLSISRLHPPGAAPLALLTVRDRSEQVAAYRRVQRTEGELRRVLVSVSDCLWSCRLEAGGRWRYRYLSPVVERITGRPVAFFLDRPEAWRDVVEPEDLPRWEQFRAELTAGRSAEIEYRLRRPDGSTAWVRESVVAAPADDAGGLLLHGVLADVTGRKQVEQAALEKRLLESQKRESLGVLAGGVAHDFNNLLAVILGNAGLAQMNCPADAAVQTYLTQIETAALHAADLCKQMLAYAGKARFVPGPVALNPLVRETVDLLSLSVPKDVSLTFELDPDLPAVQADPTQLRQVVMNLVINASEAIGDAAGHIRLRTAVVTVDADYRAAHDAAGALPDGLYVMLEVSDDGPGMPPGIQARLFEPFFTTKFTGRGLGLAAVQGIVRTHRGAIDVRSAPGVGTTFGVLLPVSRAPAEPAAGSPPAPLAWRGEGTVLVVDDEDAVRQVVGHLVASYGFRVLSARDSREAVELFRQHAAEVRLALLDVTMPGREGTDALQELRRVRVDLPVVLMSGYTEPEVMGRFPGAAPSGFLQKPFHAADLFRVLRRLSP
jgi:two-component system, cell cycle sensor histidine kinase and response regulator CckA